MRAQRKFNKRSAPFIEAVDFFTSRNLIEGVAEPVSLWFSCGYDDGRETLKIEMTPQEAERIAAALLNRVRPGLKKEG